MKISNLTSTLISNPKQAVYALLGLVAFGAMFFWAFVLILRTQIKHRKMAALWRLNNKVRNSEIPPSRAEIETFLTLFKYLKDKECEPLPSASRYLSDATKLHQRDLDKGREEEAEIRSLREKKPEESATLQPRLRDALLKIRDASKTILFIQNIRGAKDRDRSDFNERMAVSA